MSLLHEAYRTYRNNRNPGIDMANQIESDVVWTIFVVEI